MVVTNVWRSDVEMLLILGDAETLDHRCADRAQLIHDDRLLLLPARRQPGRPTPLAERLGSHRRPASALPLSDASTEHDGTPRRGVHNARIGAPQQVSPRSRQPLRTNGYARGQSLGP